jgi:hypothetical protein
MSFSNNRRAIQIGWVVSIVCILLTIGGLLHQGSLWLVRSARNLQAECTAKEIAAGMNSYFSEYGRLPSVKAGNANTAKLINTLAATVKNDP